MRFTGISDIPGDELNGVLFEIIVLCHDLVHDLQLIRLDVLLKHGRGGVTGYLHDVVDVHSAEVHQGGPGAPGGMRMDELVLGNHLPLGAASFRGDDRQRTDRRRAAGC